MLNAFRVSAVFLIFVVSTLTARPQEPPITDDVLSKRLGLDARQPFFINRERIAVYDKASGPELRTGAQAPPLGELYFGRREESGRVLLGKWTALDGNFTSELGWVDRHCVLTRAVPLTVGEVVQLGYLSSDVLKGLSSVSFSRTNALDLRVVSKPEARLEFAGAPGGATEAGGLSFTWYYVYAVEKIEGTTFYLIATQSALVNTAPHVLDTEQAGTKSRLVGWVDQSRVKEWCSNVVLEHNAESASVDERSGMGNLGKAKPALLFHQPVVGGFAAREPVSAFWSYLYGAQPTNHTIARKDPFGFDPEVPRFHVLERSHDWYRIAGLGATGTVSIPEIVKAIGQLRDANNTLRLFDLVFVVDATGSMAEEIGSVQQWLTDLCDKFAARAKSGAPVTLVIGGREVVLPTTLDIRISLVAFQDVGAGNSTTPFNAKAFLAGASLENDRAKILAAFSSLQRSLDGGAEALHDGLLRALDGQEIWRSKCSARMVVVIADEPGDSGDEAQSRVLAAMPMPPGVDVNPNGGKVDGLRREFTGIHAIYTDSDPQGFQKFRENLRMLVMGDERTYQLPFDATSGEDTAELIEILGRRLSEADETAERVIKKLAQKLLEEITPNDESGAALVDLDDIKMQHAVHSAGAKSVEDLRARTKVVFTEGWVILKQSEHQHPAYRQRIAMLRREAEELAKLTDGLATTLHKALDPVVKSAIAGPDPKEVVLRAIVLSILKVKGQAGGQSEDDLATLGLELKKEIEGRSEDAFRDLLGVMASLPCQTDGLLGTPARLVLNMVRDELIRHADLLRAKATCLRNMLNGETAPEEVDRLDDGFVPQYKEWIYKHPVSLEEFFFVPINYLP